MIRGRAVSVRARRAVVAVNFGRGKMLDAVDGDDDVALPILILRNAACRFECGEERGEERTQRLRRHRVEGGAHLRVAGDVLDVVDGAQVPAFLPRLLAEREQ